MMRALAIDLGLLVLGIVLLAAGWVLTPAASFVFPGPINEGGQSLIALGLTFIIVAVGLFLAGLEEQMMPEMNRP
jgi:membrane protease YdiL (CAAX protease family)